MMTSLGTPFSSETDSTTINISLLMVSTYSNRGTIRAL